MASNVFRDALKDVGPDAALKQAKIIAKTQAAQKKEQQRQETAAKNRIAVQQGMAAQKKAGEDRQNAIWDSIREVHKEALKPVVVPITLQIARQLQG